MWGTDAWMVTNSKKCSLEAYRLGSALHLQLIKKLRLSLNYFSPWRDFFGDSSAPTSKTTFFFICLTPQALHSLSVGYLANYCRRIRHFKAHTPALSLIGDEEHTFVGQAPTWRVGQRLLQTRLLCAVASQTDKWAVWLWLERCSQVGTACLGPCLMEVLGYLFTFSESR